MKTCFIALTILLAVVSSVTAGPNDRHWYSVTITNGTSTHTFTGTSPLPPVQIAARLGSADALALDDIHDNYATAGDDRLRWHQDLDKKQIYITLRSILYFVELTADPLLEN